VVFCFFSLSSSAQRQPEEKEKQCGRRETNKTLKPHYSARYRFNYSMVGLKTDVKKKIHEIKICN